MKPSGSPPTQATFRAASRIASAPPRERVERADPALTVERERQPAMRRPQPQYRSVEPGPTHGARLDELVVAPVDERARPELRREPISSSSACARRRRVGRRLLGRARPRLPLDHVPRALVGQEPRGDRADDLVRPRTLAAQPVSVTSPITAWWSSQRSMTASTSASRSRRDDRDHPLLRLGDHHLPGLHPLLAQRHAVELDIDAVVGRHLRERRGEPGGAAVLERHDEPALDELDGDLDQPLARERVADLHGRPLVGRLLAELGTREHGGAADPVAARRRAVEDDERARRASPSRASAARPGAARRTSR